ncbi:MAG: hypothetical protein BWX92_03242 [Deltaproteobacteria bacterium ADurb.Bin135]|nr:MAG: hypothetical protein BWX92_03242 [Deltaproteobacteria bacterium ADurb.Bin135]
MIDTATMAVFMLKFFCGLTGISSANSDVGYDSGFCGAGCTGGFGFTIFMP